MTPDTSRDRNNLERDIREAVIASRPVRTSGCLDPDVILDLVELVEAGKDPAEMQHVATCAWCRRQYVEYRASFAEADSIRLETLVGKAAPAAAAASPVLPAGSSATQVREKRSPLSWFSLRLGPAWAGAAVLAVLGYAVGRWQAPTTVNLVPVASRPDIPVKPPPVASVDVQRLQVENASLKRQLTLERQSRTAVPRPAPATTDHQAAHRPADRRPSVPSSTVTRAASIVAPVVRSMAVLSPASVSITNLSGIEERGGDGEGEALLQPARTWLTSDRPDFQCRLPGAKDDTRYTARIVTPAGETLTVEQTGPSFTWRPAYRLPRGEVMSWSVTAVVNDTEYTATGSFGILPEDEVRRVRQTVGSLSGLARARAYRKAGLLDNARSVLQRIPVTSPEHAESLRELEQVTNLSALREIVLDPSQDQADRPDTTP